jgi:hypothetical protein
MCLTCGFAEGAWRGQLEWQFAGQGRAGQQASKQASKQAPWHDSGGLVAAPRHTPPPLPEPAAHLPKP